MASLLFSMFFLFPVSLIYDPVTLSYFYVPTACFDLFCSYFSRFLGWKPTLLIWGVCFIFLIEEFIVKISLLGTALATSHKICYDMFSCSLNFIDFWICLDLLSWSVGYLDVCCLMSKVWDFPAIFLLWISRLIPLWSESTAGAISIFFIFLRFAYDPRYVLSL